MRGEMRPRQSRNTDTLAVSHLEDQPAPEFASRGFVSIATGQNDKKEYSDSGAFVPQVSHDSEANLPTEQNEVVMPQTSSLSKSKPHSISKHGNDVKSVSNVVKAVNNGSDRSVAKRRNPAIQSSHDPIAEPITGEYKEPPNSSIDEKVEGVHNSPESDAVSLPVSKSPTRGSLSRFKHRAPTLLRSSGCSNSSDGAGISCSTGSDNSGGYTGGRGSGGGTGQTGRGENGTGRRGGVSGRGDESGDVSGSGDGSGSGRGRGGRSSGGSGDSKRDKKGGGKKESSASGPRVRPQTGTLDSGLGAEKSTSDINTGTDVTNSVQGTAKLKNGSLLVPCEAQQQEPGALILPTLPLLAVGIPSSHLPSLPNAVSSSGSTPSVFVCPKKVAESYESSVQESPDYPEGGLPCLNLPLFPAAPDFGLEPVVKPFSAGCGGESNFEDTDSLLTYASPALQSQYQPIGATSTISEESSDSLEIHADVGGCNNPPRRHFSPQPFFSIKETCGELPRTSLPPVREQVEPGAADDENSNCSDNGDWVEDWFENDDKPENKEWSESSSSDAEELGEEDSGMGEELGEEDSGMGDSD